MFGRRFRFALVVLTSQLLLTALAIVMLVQMAVIAARGQVRFVEGNPLILTTEILMTAAISSFGVVVFLIQLKRLGERRAADRRAAPEPQGGRQAAP